MQLNLNCAMMTTTRATIVQRSAANLSVSDDNQLHTDIDMHHNWLI